MSSVILASRNCGQLFAKLCPALCNPMDCCLPGSSVQGFFQARIPEWVTIPVSGDLPDPGIEPRSPALQADSLPSEPPGKPMGLTVFYSIHFFAITYLEALNF